MIYSVLMQDKKTEEETIVIVEASSRLNAIERAFAEYPIFNRKTHGALIALEEFVLSPSDRCIILQKTIQMKNYDRNISDLSKMAIQENWSQKSAENIVLKNYLSKTMERLQDEGKILTTDDYYVFNTGLFTENYESIYMLAEKTLASGERYVFKEWCTEYRLGELDIPELPERADYFKDPSLLVFDCHYEIRPQYENIFDNLKNVDRLPESVKDSPMRLQIFMGAVNTAIKKVIANYRLAIPQYYEKQIQLLIPLYFEDDSKPDLAMALTKKNGYYQGHTCLTIEMAYNNARLIAKPESDWLVI